VFIALDTPCAGAIRGGCRPRLVPGGRGGDPGARRVCLSLLGEMVSTVCRGGTPGVVPARAGLSARVIVPRYPMPPPVTRLARFTALPRCFVQPASGPRPA